MDDRVKKYLSDIQSSILAIDSYLNQERNFEFFKNNQLVKRAVEREFEIIGEAMNRILKVDPTIKIENSKRIVGLRNHIIHAYDSVLEEIIWGIVMNHLPRLEEEVNALLQESP